MASTDFRELVSGWERSNRFPGDLVHARIFPARSARFEDLDPPLDPTLTERLAGKGIDRLYGHQARAIRSIRAGTHTVVVSGTASGKTLCYQIPIAERLLEDRTSTSVLVFPTKALAQDQLGSIRALSLPQMVVSTYDGDLPRELRSRVRRRANVILTNPDMLHYGILPNHGLWKGFLSRLGHVVIDEMHYMRGMFGSHTANIIRRLRRLAAHYGADPTFVLTSATIGNPVDLAERLCGVDVSLVDGDDSPAGERMVAVWNPPLKEEDSSSRRSSIAETTDLYVDLVRRGIHTIAFGRSRRATELIHVNASGRLGAAADRISPYRAGYTAQDRRDIEARLFSGELVGISATNALELGVDIGGLDAALLCTFPGTISSFRQQSGRAGREQDMALVVLVAGEDALDQYFVQHPDELFGRTPEAAVINPTNRHVMDYHLSCAAHELPLDWPDGPVFGEDLWESGARLVGEGDLRLEDRRLISTGRRSPAHGRSIRSSDARSFSIYDIGARRVIGEVDWERAFSDAHEGAVYLHKGRTYLVEELDVPGLEVRARSARVNYYTEPHVHKDLHVMGVSERDRVGSMGSFLGPVRVSAHVLGYRRKYWIRDKRNDRRTIPLELPPTQIETEAFWFTVPGSLLDKAGVDRREAPGALHAAEHTMIAMLPLFAICDRSDIGGLSITHHPQTGDATIFIHEGYQGGSGIASAAYPAGEELVKATVAALARCRCVSGCPSCVQSPKCGNFNEPLSKGGAHRLLMAALDAER
ncbi:MAG: DEAD/DEAH box helicase [Acidimicrobiia bacterium]|nr:DEAD/DEAH box helicase [Acidimicrobiia bacterium]MYC83971.1 DEAD/DEAH box helicase [Acidimicrobiia bacterium]